MSEESKVNESQTTPETSQTEESGLDFYNEGNEKPDETPAPKEEDKEKSSTGYGDTKEETEEEPKDEDKDDSTDETKVEDTSTGYDKPIEEVEEEKGEDPAVDVELGDVEGLTIAEVNHIKGIAKEAKLSKEALKVLVKYKKEEASKYDKILKDREEAHKKHVVETRKKWVKELREDADFGNNSKETFERNVNQVERVLKDFMPGTKKELTKSGTMLPPYIMKDLFAISKAVYGVEKFVQGDAPESNNKEEERSPLDFYE